MSSLKLLWQIPLACLSFIFYKIMRLIIGNAYRIYLSIASQKKFQWRVLSSEILKNPISLPVIMTKGPRWNTHAIVATAGPFRVQEFLSVNDLQVRNSAQSWTVVVYSYPGYKTIANLGSLSSENEKAWNSIKLNQGQYTLVLRYYDWSKKPELPSIKVDNKEVIPASSISPKINDFLRDLIKVKNWFYLWLHYYVFILLQFEDWLPQSFVKQEFLPVGDRDNQFQYGYIKKGECLQIQCPQKLLQEADIYLTLYNRSSFPTIWHQIKELKESTKPSQVDGFYLLRIRQKVLKSKEMQQKPLASDLVKCQTVIEI